VTRCPFQHSRARSLIVQRLHQSDETVAAIIVPITKPERGEAFAVGLGKVREDGSLSRDLKDGDTILFGKCSG
jgi:co-chaperonin GroES (HSP10)